MIELGSRQGCPPLGTILLVDDDDETRDVLRAYLEGHGLAVQEASDAIEAIQKADTLKASLSILVADLVMPKMSGIQLAHVLRKKHLDLPLVFMSGYPAADLVHQLFKGAAFLEKPFGCTAFIHAIWIGMGICPAANAQ